MWIKCDPNRGDTNPDDIINREGSSYDGKPEWTWFVPRAEATLQFLDDAGYKIVKKQLSSKYFDKPTFPATERLTFSVKYI